MAALFLLAVILAALLLRRPVEPKLAAAVGAMEHCLKLPRREIAMTSASATNCAVMLLLIDKPVTRRENRSVTTAT